MLKAKIILLLLFLSGSLCAQMSKDIFPLNRQFRAGGLYIAPELTYLYPFLNTDESVENANVQYDYQVNGNGRIGFGLEVGWFHSFKTKRFVDFLEGGIGYRQFNGEARHRGVRTVNQVSSNFDSENKLSVGLVQASLRASHVNELGRNRFFVHSLGLHANYFLTEQYDRSDTYPLQYDRFTSSPSIQLHYQIGYGFPLSPKLFMIPSLETSLLTAYPIDDLRPGFNFFDLDYQPLIFKLRFLFLREDPVNCNAPVYNGPANPQ